MTLMQRVVVISSMDEYIGHTTTTLSRRLTMHLQSGSILDHFRYAHQKKLTRPILEEGTSIVAIEPDSFRLKIREALYILTMRPGINRQFDKFPQILRLFGVGTRDDFIQLVASESSDGGDKVSGNGLESSSHAGTVDVEPILSESSSYHIPECVLASSNITIRKHKN